jgi:hypothetical protein
MDLVAETWLFRSPTSQPTAQDWLMRNIPDHAVITVVTVPATIGLDLDMIILHIPWFHDHTSP